MRATASDMSDRRPKRGTTPVSHTTDHPMLDQLLTSRQIAASFGMPRSTVEDYARRGILPSIKIGRHRRFVRDRVEEALRRLMDADDTG